MTRYETQRKSLRIKDKRYNRLELDNQNKTNNTLFSCISIGTRTGYKIYTCEPFGKCYGKRSGGIGIAEMLFCTSLIALVGAGEHPSFSPRKLQIVNTKRQSTICELTFSTAVLGVKLNRKRLIVVLEEHIYVYDISNMKLLHTIDTSPNPNALCSLSPSSENCYLVYPSNASSALGEVLVFDGIKLQAVNILQAHKSPLACLSFNYEGRLVATSSDKGTVIRVFSIPAGQMLHQFRRGTYTARIFSISFNLMSSMLCVSSDTDTVHIYKLGETRREGGNGGSSGSEEPRAVATGEEEPRVSHYLDQLTSPLVQAAGAVGSFLPTNLTDIWDPQRHFAYAKIPATLPTSTAMTTPGVISSGNGGGVRDRVTICSFIPGPGDRPVLAVVTSEGSFFLFGIDMVEGGECGLIRADTIMNEEEET